jgi:hypothetical protein
MVKGSSFATWTKRLQGKISPSKRRDSPQDGIQALVVPGISSRYLPSRLAKEEPTTMDDIEDQPAGLEDDRVDVVERRAYTPTTHMTIGGDERDDRLMELVDVQSHCDNTVESQAEAEYEDEVGSVGPVPAYDWATLVFEPVATGVEQPEEGPEGYNEEYHNAGTAYRFQVDRNDFVAEARGASYKGDDSSARSVVEELEEIPSVPPDELKAFEPLVYHNRITDGFVEHEQGKHSLLPRAGSMTSAESVASGNTRSEENVTDRSRMKSPDPEEAEVSVTSDIHSRHHSQDQTSWKLRALLGLPRVRGKLLDSKLSHS